jgi:hypothetical protein
VRLIVGVEAGICGLAGAVLLVHLAALPHGFLSSALAAAGLTGLTLLPAWAAFHEASHWLVAGARGVKRASIGIRMRGLLPVPGLTVPAYSRAESPEDRLAIALAGPTADLLACASISLAARLLPAPLLDFWLLLGIGLVCANALPVGGTDGAQVAQAALACANAAPREMSNGAHPE